MHKLAEVMCHWRWVLRVKASHHFKFTLAAKLLNYQRYELSFFIGYFIYTSNVPVSRVSPP